MPEAETGIQKNQSKLSSQITLKPSPILIDNETQSTITCSKLTIETLEQGVKYVQS